MLQTIARPALIGWVLLGLFLLFFPYLHTWPGASSFLDSIDNATGLGIGGTFGVFQMTTLGVWLVVLTGLNILTGYSGQISLGHGAFVAAGAYITAILLDQTATPLVIAILASAIGTMAIGFAIGIPSLRLTGPYLAIATLAIVVSLPQFLKWDKVNEWTKGATGIDLPSADVPTFLGLDRFMDDSQWLYYSVMVPAVIMTILAWNLMRSRFGRAFIALRDSEIGAQQMGVNVSLYKTLAFAISALYAGVGGGLFAYSQDFVSPDSFGVFQSIEFLVVIVIGGLASTLGSVLAAIFFVYQDGVVERLAEIVGFPVRLRWAFFGVGLILIMIIAPNGVAGLVQRMKRFRLSDAREVLRQVRPSAMIRWLRSHPIAEQLGFGTQADEDPGDKGR